MKRVLIKRTFRKGRRIERSGKNVLKLGWLEQARTPTPKTYRKPAKKRDVEQRMSVKEKGKMWGCGRRGGKTP